MNSAFKFISLEFYHTMSAYLFVSATWYNRKSCILPTNCSKPTKYIHVHSMRSLMLSNSGWQMFKWHSFKAKQLLIMYISQPFQTLRDQYVYFANSTWITLTFTITSIDIVRLRQSEYLGQSISWPNLWSLSRSPLPNSNFSPVYKSENLSAHQP